MEIKKSNKADLEHWRPWMFLAGIVIMVIVFFLVLEVRVVANYIASISLDDEINMDLNIKPKDDRDLISAEEKKKLRKEEKGGKATQGGRSHGNATRDYRQDKIRAA